MLWIVLIKKKVTEKKIPNIYPVSERSSWFTQVHEQKRRKILILAHEVDFILCRGKTVEGNPGTEERVRISDVTGHSGFKIRKESMMARQSLYKKIRKIRGIVGGTCT
jgi:hypothetical protein